MRMVHDFLNVKCHTLEIPIDPGMGIRYGIRKPTNPKLKRMYLTEWQKSEMKDETDSVCNFIELDPNLVPKFKYGLPEK
ncbi:MAG: hypothetical protein ACYDHX_13225 [Methanothrix sp.]